jgi:hypothetical protein
MLFIPLSFQFVDESIVSAGSIAPSDEGAVILPILGNMTGGENDYPSVCYADSSPDKGSYRLVH